MDTLMKFIHQMEKLKCEKRHVFKSNGIPESVAEHCWRVCILILLVSDRFSHLNIDKCIKMALIHDLPEIITGDTYKLNPENQINKHNREEEALIKLTAHLPKRISDEIIKLWLEFDEAKTGEARLVNLLDRLEVLVQHNEADISTWSDVEKRIHYGLAGRHAEKYGYLHDFAVEIDNETKEKLNKAGYEPEKLSLSEYKFYYNNG